MKKVLIIVAAAIAATFSMTSCVETTESASVTALREAKAEQYRALADMYRAQGAADSVRAAAEAAVQQALAAYHQAVADSVKQDNEQAAQEFALRLEYLKAWYQNEILKLEEQMKDKELDIAKSANNYIKYLYNRYKNQVTKLNNLNNELFMTQVNLAEANAKLLDAQAYVAEKTALYNEEIATAKAKIEIYNNYSGVDRADIEAQRDALKLNVDVLMSDMAAKRVLKEQAYQDVKDYIADYFTLRNKSLGYNELETTVALLKTIDTIRNEYKDFISSARKNLNSKIFIVREKKNVELPADFDYDRTFVNQPDPIKYIVYSLDAEVREAVIDEVEMDIETYIETELGVPGTETTAATLLYLAEQIAKTQLDNVNASPNATDAEKENAQKKYDKALEDLAEGEAKLAEKEANLANLNRLLKAYDDGYAAYKAELSAFVDGELVKAYFQTCIDHEAAYDLYQDNQAQIEGFDDLLEAGNGTWVKGEQIGTDEDGNPVYDYEYIPGEGDIIDVQQLIKEQEEAIADAEAKIEALGFIEHFDFNNSADKDNTDPAQNEVLAQYLIDLITANIAQLEQEIAIQQQIVDAAKAALDEALATESAPAE